VNVDGVICLTAMTSPCDDNWNDSEARKSR
jgi:hypothetical protein